MQWCTLLRQISQTRTPHREAVLTLRDALCWWLGSNLVDACTCRLYWFFAQTMTGLALRTELGACFRRGVSMGRTVWPWGCCTISFAWPRFQFGIIHFLQDGASLMIRSRTNSWLLSWMWVRFHLNPTWHLPVKHFAPVRPQMVPSTWCNWILRPWPWYHGCNDLLFQCPVDFSWIQLIQLVETLPRKRRRQLPVWVMKCKEWTSWSLWRRDAHEIPSFFLLELV